MKDSAKLKKDDYSTTNIYEVAYCLYRGFELIGKESLGSKALIHIGGTINEDGKKLAPQDVVLEYYKSEFKKFLDCYKTARDYTYQDQFNK